MPERFVWEFLYLTKVDHASYHIFIFNQIGSCFLSYFHNFNYSKYLFTVSLWIPNRRVKNLSQNPGNLFQIWNSRPFSGVILLSLSVSSCRSVMTKVWRCDTKIINTKWCSRKVFGIRTPSSSKKVAPQHLHVPLTVVVLSVLSGRSNICQCSLLSPW